MLRSLKEIMGYRIAARDGEIGKVADFYFDDATWHVRYVVAATGGRLSGRQVLFSPLSVGQPDHVHRTLPVTLTVQQVADSPPVDSDLPVSRQHEIKLASYYNWPPYWGAAGMPVAGPGLATVPDFAVERVDHPGDPHLRSVEAVSTYSIQATDKAIGHVVDFIAETEGWCIRYMVAATRDFLPGRKVLVAPDWLTKVDWANRVVHVNLTSEQLRGCEEFDPSRPVNREIELRLYDYYGRPKYWESEKTGP
jgi:hypothetical protein